MKARKVTKQRRQSREFDVMSDLRSEFDDVLDDSFIDELALAEIEDED